MKQSLIFIRSKLTFLVAVVLAATVGGIMSTVVKASIPDSNGTIHGCYSNGRGILSIIDSPSQSCGSGETGLNWSQHGGPVLHDAGGQSLGNVVGTPGENPLPWVVYHATLDRFIYIAYSGSGNKSTIISPRNVPYFESDDCTGQAYAFNDLNSNDMKTNLIRVNTSSYGVVQANASSQNLTMGSIRQYDYSNDSFNCNDITDATDSYYAISSTSLPFSLPIANPLKL